MGQAHFWITFVGAYAIFFPMHYLGFLGLPRRYYSFEGYDFVSSSVFTLNQWVSVLAIVVAAAQLIFLWNLAWSWRHGVRAKPNPWRATTLEWQTANMPPGHGNWGERLPVVHRWAFDYGLPREKEDFVPQTQPEATHGRPA